MRSISIFGSTARNRADSLSDRDILVVASSKRELTTASRRWSSDGWSVAMLTRQQITSIADRGLLFLQHLKQEAIIVEDDDNFLRSLMDGYNPKRKFEEELGDSLALLQDLSRRRPDYWSTMCSADIAYVAIRNIAIMRLAERGKYIFDYCDLMSYFESERRISPEKLDALCQLRFLKHSYRRRLTSNAPWEVVERALEGAMELFGADAQSQAPNQSGISGYRGLRLLELELVGKMDPRYLDGLPPRDPLGAAWTCIRDPRGYPNPKPRSHRWLRSVSELAERRRMKLC